MGNDTDILAMELREAWNIFKNLIETSDKTYKLARFGVKMNFDINDYFRDCIRTKKKQGVVIVNNSAYSMSDFHTELDYREKKIKKWLIANLSEDPLAKPYK